jgi:hypothetical protein
VLVHSLSVCISLLDPKRLVSASYQAFRSQLSHGTLVTASPETVNGMLENLGQWFKLLYQRHFAESSTRHRYTLMYCPFIFCVLVYIISGDLLKLLDVSSAENVLPTAYGSLQPPLGKQRLKVHSVYLKCSRGEQLNYLWSCAIKLMLSVALIFSSSYFPSLPLMLFSLSPDCRVYLGSTVNW